MTRPVVVLSRRAGKELRKAPRHVAMKLLGWIDLVDREGLLAARRVVGYRDEALRGKRWGQRSIRLSRSWRAICRKSGSSPRIEVLEVTHHEY